jgi:hypothetical protein
MHLFISNLNITTPPWSVNQVDDVYEIVNSDQTLVAAVPIDPREDLSRIQANAAVLAAAPELLAALKEAAFILESRGEPLGEPYFELINRASPALPPIPYPRPQR